MISLEASVSSVGGEAGLSEPDRCRTCCSIITAEHRCNPNVVCFIDTFVFGLMAWGLALWNIMNWRVIAYHCGSSCTALVHC